MNVRMILSNSLIYALSTFVSKVISFAALPLFTYYLAKEDYGILGIIASIALIVNAFVGLNPSLFIIVKGSQQGREELSQYVYHAIILAALSFMCVPALLLLFGATIVPAGLKDSSIILTMIAIYGLFNVALRLLDTVLQLERRAMKFSALQICQSLLTTGLALLLVVYFSIGWKGMFFSDFVVLAMLALYSMVYLSKNSYVKKKYDPHKMKELFKYLFPLTFHVLGFAVMASVDKLFIASMVSLEATGVYNIALTVAMIVSVLHDSVLKAWNPFFYEEIHRSTAASSVRIVKTIYLYYAASLIVLGAFVLLVPYVFPLLIDRKFGEALHILPTIAFAYTILGMRNVLAGYLYHANKTNILAVLTAVAACFNIVFNYFLIGRHGILGAAEALVYSNIILFFLTAYFADRHAKISWLLR